MTALNGIVLPTGVHLLTDGATYDKEGRILAIRSKVYEYRRERIAIGWAGFCRMPMIAWGLRLALVTDQASIVAALPKVARWIVMLNRWRDIGRTPQERGLRFMVALWSDREDEPQLWTMHSDSLLLGPEYKPFTMVRLHRYFDVVPGTEFSAIGRQLTDWRQFDPVRDGLALLEHQRREPWDDGRFCVGGAAYLTTVSRAGVKGTILREWPDKVGEFVRPVPAP